MAMMKSLAPVALFILLACSCGKVAEADGSCSQVCPTNTVEVNGTYCFRLGGLAKNWDLANATCVAEGGYLARPDLNYDQLANDLSVVYEDITRYSYVWIGARETTACIEWNWIDGGVLSSDDSNWYSGHPGSTEVQHINCAVIYRFVFDQSVQIMTSPCRYGRYYLCQFDPIDNPEPSTTAPTTTTAAEETTTPIANL